MKTYCPKNKFIFFGFVSIWLYSSCTESIEMDFQTNYTGLVVSGKITTDTTRHKVIISKSGDVLNRQPVQYISDAIVTISDGKDTFKLAENMTDKGVYETEPTVYGIPGKTYFLNISNVDVNNDGIMETYTAQSFLKKENPIDSIALFRQHNDSYDNGWSVNLYAQEIGGGRNYYLIKIRKNGIMLTDSISEFSIANNAGFEGKYYFGLSTYLLSYNKTDERLIPNDTVTLELGGITEDYFNFIDGYKQEAMPKNPIFSGPSANPYTNIVPGENASGFFAAYSIQRKSRIYK